MREGGAGHVFAFLLRSRADSRCVLRYLGDSLCLRVGYRVASSILILRRLACAGFPRACCCFQILFASFLFQWGSAW